MPAKRTTDLIDSIEKKKGLYIIKTKGWSASISQSFYAEELLYVGKVLTNNDKIRLSHLEKISLPMDYVHRLLARGLYSVHMMREKIALKFPECDDLNEIIYRLKEEGLLDDKAFAEAYKESKEAQLYGPTKIKDELRYTKGVSQDIINELRFADEEAQLEQLFPILDRRYQNQTLKSKQAKLTKLMIDRGYSKDLAYRFALNSSVDPKAIKKRFEADLEKAKRIYGST